MKKLWILLLGAMSILSACGLMPPSVSSNIIEADPNGSLISISAQNCQMGCTELVLQKARDVCPRGYSIKNRLSDGLNRQYNQEQIIVRCSN